LILFYSSIFVFKFCSFARDNFNFGATGNAMKWRYYESNFEEYNTDSPDKTIQWAESNGWGFRGKII
jgi:GH35 family endo-1,4-beta-xylanase